jgi:protein ImuA
MTSSAVRAKTIDALRRQLISSQKSGVEQKCVSTGLASLDQLLPNGGLPTSSIIEWISDDPGQGAASIALRSIAPMLALAGCLAVIDERHEFHADCVRAQGIPLSRLLLIRPPRHTVDSSTAGSSRFVRRTTLSQNQSLWALEQSARCPGVRVVLCWMDRCSSAVMRRLQLAVERSGVTIVLIRPANVLAQSSFADLRLHVQTVNPPQTVFPPKARSQRQRDYMVRLLRSRHGLEHQGVASLNQAPWEEQVRSS